MELQFDFNFDRTLQAAAHLLKLTDGQEMRYIHLIKMLYIADRQFLAERGYPITGDKPVAMRLGPVLSNTLNLIKSDHRRISRRLISEWQRYVYTPNGSHIARRISDPGNGDLGKASMSMLNDIFEKYGKSHPFDVVDVTHEFEEWLACRQGNTSVPISLSAILQAQGAGNMMRSVETQVQLHAHQKALQDTCQPPSLLDIYVQIEDIRQLEDGWLDGDGMAFSKQGLDWVAEKLDDYFSDIIPHLYPTPQGEVRAEWSLGKLEISLDIDIEKQSGYWHTLDISSGIDTEENLDLSNIDDWEWILDTLLTEMEKHK